MKKTLYLSIDHKGLLEIWSGFKRLEMSLDIMNEYDKSLEEWNKVKKGFDLNNGYAVSSAIDFPSEFGVDDAILNSFINSMLGIEEKSVMAS